MKEIIQINSLTKMYGTKKAVDCLSLGIYEGELFSLLGVNGAGKTTTIRILSGLIKPTNGTATVDNYDIIKDSQKIKELTNVSPQETAVAGNLTIEENLNLIGSIYGLHDEELKNKINQIISDFDLEEYRHSKAKILSGGWQRRLSIAMALISDPKILFLDEPTLGLDVIARHELWNQIKKLKNKMTIILTTHYLEEVEELSDRVGIMLKGKIKEIGTVEEIKIKTDSKSLEDAFIKISTGDNL